MSTDWSDNIVVEELSDEPGLSEELGAVIGRAQRDERRAPHVVLNFSQVTYINSSNLAQLLKLKKVLTERDAKLRLCTVSEQVHSVFQVTGLDKVFHFTPDPLTALAGLQLEESAG